MSQHQNNTSSKSALFPIDAEVVGIFLLTLAITVYYALKVGVVAIWPDALFYADRARHILEQGNAAISPAYPAQLPPFYSLLMLPGFAAMDIARGHMAIILIQACLVAVSYFPLRLLVMRGCGSGNFAACITAGLMVLSPSFLSYAPMLLAIALASCLTIFFVYFLDVWLCDKTPRDAWLGGICLGLLLLTDASGWVLWVATGLVFLLQIAQKKLSHPREGGNPIFLFAFLILPLLFFSAWQSYSTFILHAAAADDSGWNVANGLARFNLVKNGLLYMLYAGAPMATLALFVASFSRRKLFWQNPFFAFVFFAVLGIVGYTAFSTPIIVAKKLDFIFNRPLEAFTFLPLLVLLRLPDDARKEILSNGMLIFFVLMVFGYPYVIHPDFNTGLAYWAQSLQNHNLGLFRNAMMLIFMLIPVSTLFFKPHWFHRHYIGIMAAMFILGLLQSGAVWRYNQDGHPGELPAAALYNDETLRKEKPVVVDFRCRGGDNNDVAHLFRCLDVTKALYFLPRLPRFATMDALAGVDKGEGGSFLFMSSEHDNRIGTPVADADLAHITRVTSADMETLHDVPLVQVDAITGMQPYVRMILFDISQQVTLLDAESRFDITADREGCAEMNILLAMDDQSRELGVNLNGQDLEPIVIAKLDKNKEIPPTVLRLQLPQGKSQLTLHYGVKPTNPYDVIRDLIMRDRPAFLPCQSFGRIKKKG